MVPEVRSLAWATDIDVLPIDRVVQRRDGYWVVRSPSNPAHWFGNFLLFDEAPGSGDRGVWEDLFDGEFKAYEGVRHRVFLWDDITGAQGAAADEFIAHGYMSERTVALTARPGDLLTHPRENREVMVRALRPEPGADDELWSQVAEIQVAARNPEIRADAHRTFVEARLRDVRELFSAGRGSWFVALDGSERGGSPAEVVGSCGLVVTGPRGRYQAVDTVSSHRRRGICSRLVIEAARRTAEEHQVEHLVICADPEYYAIGIYESLGFSRAETVTALLLRPPEQIVPG